MGTLRHIIFADNHRLPMLPIAIIVQFDDKEYTGPSFCEDMKKHQLYPRILL